MDRHQCNLIIDTCCDLPAELVDRDGITIINFAYSIGNGTFTDDFFQSEKPREFYDKIRKGAEPKTSQVPLPTLMQAFEESAKSGKPAVYLSFSSGLSGNYDTAQLALEQVRISNPECNVTIVDTKLGSAAEGLLVLGAIEQWDKGMTATELSAWAEEARWFVNCEFLLDDLEVLKRGGRMPAAAATAGALLNVKPLLSIDEDGALSVAGAARGMKKGVIHLAEYYEKNHDRESIGTYAIIGQADNEKEAKRLRDKIESGDSDVLIIPTSIGPVIGSHTGPGMVGIAFWGHDRREKATVANKIASSIRKEKAEQQ